MATLPAEVDCHLEPLSWFSGNERDSRGVLGFFLAILPAVTQFDVWPIGWYNCRMEFLGRTIVEGVTQIDTRAIG